MHQAFKFKCWEKCVASLMDLCMRGNPCLSLPPVSTAADTVADAGVVQTTVHCRTTAWHGIRWRATILTEISSGIRVVDCVHLFYSLSSAFCRQPVRSLHPDSPSVLSLPHFPRLCFSWDLRNGSGLIFVLWCPGHRQIAMDLLCGLSHHATTWNVWDVVINDQLILFSEQTSSWISKLS